MAPGTWMISYAPTNVSYDPWTGQAFPPTNYGAEMTPNFGRVCVGLRAAGAAHYRNDRDA